MATHPVGRQGVAPTEHGGKEGWRWRVAERGDAGAEVLAPDIEGYLLPRIQHLAVQESTGKY